MQLTPSLQFGGVPDWQSFTASHVSVPLQKSPSLQSPSFGTLSHEFVPSLHESVVQLTPSSQFGGAPDWQSFTASHVSAPLQKSPSSQSPSFGTLSHEFVPSLHESVVQLTPSLQFGGVPDWQSFTASHVSVPLQKSPSLQSPSFGTLSHVFVASLDQKSGVKG